MKELTPEILEQVAQVGNGYITFLYFQHITEFMLISALLGLMGYGLYKIIQSS
jgi:hypothetical protein